MISEIKEKWKKSTLKMSALKQKTFRQYYDIEAKYRYTSLYGLSSFLIGIEVFVATLIILSLLQLADVINLTYFNVVFESLPVIPNDLNRQLVFAQISITFIITSLFSLIITLRKEKVLGTSIYTIAFARSIFGSLLIVSLTVFFMLFLNIFLFLNNKSPEAISAIFLITLGVFSFFILKIILFTNNSRISVDKIASIYLWENRKTIKKRLKKGFYRNSRDSKYLFNLSEDTIEKILKKDIEYIRNFQTLESITNLSLYNYKLEIQEYHLDWKFSHDTIEYWISAIEELLRAELYADALNQYTRMLNLFIHHKVYISSYRFKDLLTKIFSGISSKKNKSVFDQNKVKMINAMKSTMQYTYFKINNDFSYTRLGKLNRLQLNSISDSFLIDYYSIIDKKLDLSDLEKSEELISYFENIRQISDDITSFSDDNLIGLEDNKRSKELVRNSNNLKLLGQPLSKLMILLIQEEKTSRTLYFLKHFNNDAIYYSCLVIAAKLTNLYFSVDSQKRKIISDNLMMIMAKLVEWDGYKIEVQYRNLVKEVKGKPGYVKQTYAFSDKFLRLRDLEYLTIVKNTIFIKRSGVNIESINFSNDKLEEISKLFSKVDLNILDRTEDEIVAEIEEKFGILHFL